MYSHLVEEAPVLVHFLLEVAEPSAVLDDLPLVGERSPWVGIVLSGSWVGDDGRWNRSSVRRLLCAEESPHGVRSVLLDVVEK